MASIDKIYGTKLQADILRNWLQNNNPDLLDYLYDQDGFDHLSDNDDRPISNFPEWADAWLLRNCDIDYIVETIENQYQSGGPIGIEDCPFEYYLNDVYEVAPHVDQDLVVSGPFLHFVECRVCGATGPLANSSDEAVRMWNRICES